MTITYLDAPAGAGKTHALVQYAHDQARMGFKVLFVQPTIELIKRTCADELQLLKPRYSVKEIYGGDDGLAPVTSIVNHFRACDGLKGEIVFCTHSAFFKVPYFDRSNNWIVIVDEVPTVDVFDELDVSQNHSFITRYLRFEPECLGYGRLKSSDSAALNRIATNRENDAVTEVFQSCARRVGSTDWSVYANAGQYANLVQDTDSTSKLITHSVLQHNVFDRFKKIIIASSCFEETMIFNLWKHECKFEPLHKSYRDTLRFADHQNGDLISVHYFLDEKWSKTLGRKSFRVDDDSVVLLDKIIERVAKLMGEEPFAWMANKDVKDNVFLNSKGFRLPNTPHGLNLYQHLHNAVILSALNPPPAHFKFLDWRGVEGDDVRRAVYFQAAYQAAMRISIRDPNDSNEKHIFVMDRGCAVYLATKFPGSKIVFEDLGFEVVNGKPGRTRKHVDSKSKAAACRRKNDDKLKAILEFSGNQRLSESNLDYDSESYQKFCNDNTFIYKVNSLRKITLVQDVYSTEFDSIEFDDDDGLVAEFEAVHNRVLSKKDDNWLMIPADIDFDIPDVGTKRGLANVKSIRGIWLDNDGGDLTHDEFSRLLPNCRIVVWNTFSSTKAKPRWRAFIPTSTTMAASVYRLIIDQIVKVLEAGGYWGKRKLEKDNRIKSKLRHGFDESKFPANSMFYLPCQAEEEGGSFFIDYNDNERGPLDVKLVIENLRKSLIRRTGKAEERKVEPSDQPAPFVPSIEGRENNRVVNQAQIDQATTDWRGTKKGSGNDEFFRFARKLRRAGLTLDEIEPVLRSEAQFAHSPKDRRGQVKSIMKSLSRIGRL